LFRRIGADATAALEEVRALARGVYPAVLVDHGLVQALGDAATRSSLRVTVSARGITRYPQEVEAAVYFCCLEALQNAEKHGRARSVAIGLVGNDAVTFEIRDDGRGFDPGAVTEGTGLMHIRDRVAAVGGHVRIESVIGGGTLIAGSVPMAPDHVPAEIERFVLRATDSLDPLTICRAIRTATGSIVDFMVEHVNDAACRAAGLTRDAQVGMTLGQLQPGYPRSELFRWHCDALAVSEPLVREDITFVGESGWRRISSATEMRAIALGAERLALLSRDITARKRAQRELEVRAEALADESAAVCVVRVTTGAIVFANRAFERMFGFAESELEGRLISDLEADVPPYTTPASGYLDNVVHLRRKDGSTLWSEVMRDGFEDSELGWCAVEVHRDVTASKQQAAEHETYRDRLSRALRGLPAVAYMTGRDLNPVLLFDSLIEPDGDPSRTGSADELFGRELGEHVAEVNRRVFVTGRPAKIEIEGGLGEPTGILTVEPVLTSTGSVAGVVGTVLQPGADGGLEKVTQPARQAGRMNVRRFGRAS
jgi:PAS domain S-box-containing protein